MIVGLLTLELLMHESNSLKDKRRILRSLYDGIRRKFNVSVAEVDYHDLWRRAVLGIACVSTDTRQVNKVLSTVAAFVEGRGNVVVTHYSIEIL